MVRIPRVRGIRWLALSTLIVTAAACTGSSSEPSSSNDTASGGIQAPASPAPELTTFEGKVVGGGDIQGYTAEMPGTWTTYRGSFMVNLRPAVMGLSVWNVGSVPRHPCHWKETTFLPGP